MQIDIYTQSYCGFCRAALDLLRSRGVDFVHHDMDGKGAELSEIKRRYGHPTIPVVLIDGELVGGYTELARLDAAGRLG